MRIQNYDDAPELQVIRKHNLFKAIRARAIELSESREGLEIGPVPPDLLSQFSPAEKFVFSMDNLRSNLISNCKGRAYIKYKMEHALDNDRITIQIVKLEYRSYLSECVILFDRLANWLGMLEFSFKHENISFKKEEDHMLGFFNPMVNDARNTNMHGYYVDFVGWEEADKLERKITSLADEGNRNLAIEQKYIEEIVKIINGHVHWFDQTEKAFSGFFENFFNSIADKLLVSKSLLLPKNLPKNFKTEFRRKDSLRKDSRHEKTFHSINADLQGDK